MNQKRSCISNTSKLTYPHILYYLIITRTHTKFPQGNAIKIFEEFFNNNKYNEKLKKIFNIKHKQNKNITIF